MEKKELILMVAKDLIVGGRMYTDPGISTENKVKEIGKLLKTMSKEVERVYDAI